eukprot:807462-Amphidinium_carterae.1
MVGADSLSSGGGAHPAPFLGEGTLPEHSQKVDAVLSWQTWVEPLCFAMLSFNSGTQATVRTLRDQCGLIARDSMGKEGEPLWRQGGNKSQP